MKTSENYYEDDKYFSVSAFKKFQKCEYSASLGVYRDEMTTPMLVGSYVDSAIEGTLDEFVEAHPEIISSRGKTKGELKVDYKKADDIIQYIESSPRLMQFLSGEKQVVMTGEISGVPFKIKMDSYTEGVAISDLKVLASVTGRNGQYYDFITPWGYDVQLACYQEIVRQNTGDTLPCFIVAVTKEEPINSVIVNIPQVVLDRALYSVESDISHYYDVFMGKVEPVGCGVCSDCIKARKDTPLIDMGDIIEGGII